jgi:hypothetical protein
MPGRFAKISFFSILIVILVVFLLFHWLKQRDYREEFAAMRGELLSVETIDEEIGGGYIYRSIESESSTGILLSARLKIPEGAESPLPAIIILGGLRTGSMTVDYIREASDMIIMAIDYPYQGKKENLTTSEFMLALSGIHKAVLETPPAVILGVDYLLSMDEADPDRITLIGGSLGAFFVPAVMAADQRIDAAAILFGAGDLQALIKSEIDMPFPLPHLGSWAASVLLAPVEPMKYIEDISPRPVFILNGRSDNRIPVKLAEKLHREAKEPKKIVWIEAEHLNVRTDQFHSMVSGKIMDWLERIQPGGAFSDNKDAPR